MSVSNAAPTTVSNSAAYLDASHGYAFEGDRVHLRAQINPGAALVAGGEWAVQLWACAAPFAGGELRGAKIAELRTTVAADAPAQLDATTEVQLPAGHGEHAMVLVLAGGDDGCCTAIHDYANYPRAERFVLPNLGGAISYSLVDACLNLAVGSVDNPRPAGNLSGSLALEFWALDAAYDGSEAFTGSKLAGVDLGTLAGGCAFENLNFELTCSDLPVGQRHAVLMLREWTAGGWVTRDYTVFPQLVDFQPAPQAPAAEIAVPAAVAEAPVVEAAPVAQPAKAAKTTTSKAKTKAAPAAAVSVNYSSAAELADVKGISKTVAAAIVAARPYASLDDLLRAKGVGAKLLDKVRAQLTL